MPEEEKEVKQEVNQEPNIYDKALAAAERLEQANKKQEELLTRQESLMAKQLLSGRSIQSPTEPEKPKELTAKEYAQLVKDGKINPFKP